MHKHPLKGNKMPRESLYKTMILLKWAESGNEINIADAAHEYEKAWNILNKPSQYEMEKYLYSIKHRIEYKYEEYMKIKDINERFEKYKKERKEFKILHLGNSLCRQGALRILKKHGKRHSVKFNYFVYDPENNAVKKDIVKTYYHERSKSILEGIKESFNEVMREKYEKYDQSIPYKIEVDDYSFHFAHKRECEIKFYVQSVDDVIRIPFSFVVRKQSYELLNVFSECLFWTYTNINGDFKSAASEIYDTAIKYDFRINNYL